ncbi:MAG: putative HTH-type transcriptional regulator, partial [Ilumatobacteraceae bacterium]|nr:putative HTH-type transcriptional regulator [Ilumatobacteraceae bacterium]
MSDRRIEAGHANVGHNRVVGMTVRILGPVAIDRPSEPCGPLSPKLRLVLALLVANRGAVVSTDRFCDALWGDEQPSAGIATLQSHLSRLRRLLGPDGRIVALDRGYRLDLAEDGIDAGAFSRLAGEASQAPDARRAADLYGSALSLWRGPAFGELRDLDPIRPEAVRLDELRQAVTEEWVESRLVAGGDASLVADLDGLTVRNPLRERFLRQLMTALFREGRHAEALRRASEFRRLLREDIGLEPSSALAAVEGQILDDDVALRGVPTVFVAPRLQLPVIDDPTRLVGREVDLVRIGGAIGDDHLVTLVGPGGVGKTRLARRVAVTSERFDDGVVLVELAAISDGNVVLDAVATALGVQPQQQLTMRDTLLAALAERHQLVVF